MPEKNKNDTVKVRDYHMQIMQPFMIIADFETYTDKLHQIKPYLFALFIHCIFNESNNKLTHYTGEDCLDEFFNDLAYHVNRINIIKAKPNPYSNPNVYKSNNENAICIICSNQILTNNPHTYYYYFEKKQDIYVDLDMVNVMNENYKSMSYFMMVQNLILDSYLAEKCTHSNISCIAHSMETFLTFSITNFNNIGMNLRFIDSCKHLTSSLDGLVNSLLNKDTNVQSTKSKFSLLFQTFKDDAMKLLRKGVYPYDYMDEDWENKLKEKELPILNIFILV